MKETNKIANKKVRSSASCRIIVEGLSKEKGGRFAETREWDWWGKECLPSIGKHQL